MVSEDESRGGEPSIGGMTYRRIACCASVAFLLVAPAAAEGATKKPTVAKELSRLAATGAIPAAERNERLSAFNAVKRSVRRLPKRSTRRNELAGVVATVEGIAARRALTGPRPVSYTHLTLPTTPYV